MKFKNYVTSIENVNIYPMVSLVIFTVFFAVVTWYVLSANNEKMEKNSQIPIND